ncbi:MAG: hypothetical protein NVSMB64_22590 [Candidatus Velthaea sp.]
MNESYTQNRPNQQQNGQQHTAVPRTEQVQIAIKILDLALYDVGKKGDAASKAFQSHSLWPTEKVIHRHVIDQAEETLVTTMRHGTSDQPLNFDRNFGTEQPQQQPTYSQQQQNR